MKQLSQWRSVIVILALGLMLLDGLWICSQITGPVALVVGMIFTAFSAGIVGLGGLLTAKSSVEHLAGGGGIRGAVAALMTSAKPEPAPSAPIPQGEPPPGCQP